MMNSTLRLQVNGERIRSLINLRLKDYDRAIERIASAITVTTVELKKSDQETIENVDAMRERIAMPVAVAGRGGLMGNRYDEESRSVGFGKVISLREQLDKFEQVRAQLISFKAQAEWLRDSFEPNGKYELSGDDLITLGVGERALPRSVFDPLDLA